MKPVNSPNHPSKGTVRRNDAACCQSTSPAAMGANAEMSASSPDAVAIGIASLAGPFDATQVDCREEDDQSARNGGDGNVRQVPLVDCRAREDRGQATGRDPAPPVANASEIGQYRVVRTKGLCTGRRDTSNPLRIHEDEFCPSWRGDPRQQESDDQQWYCGASLTRDIALSCEERRDQEEALVAAAHGQRCGSDPTERARMISRRAPPASPVDSITERSPLIVRCHSIGGLGEGGLMSQEVV